MTGDLAVKDLAGEDVLTAPAVQEAVISVLRPEGGVVKGRVLKDGSASVLGKVPITQVVQRRQVEMSL